MAHTDIVRKIIHKGEPVNSAKFREAINWLLRQHMDPSYTSPGLGGTEDPGGEGSGGGGLPDGFTILEDVVVDIQYVDGNQNQVPRVQIKRGDVLARNVDEEWTDLIVPAKYDA